VRRSVLLAFIALALALRLPFGGAADPPGRYQGALGGTPYLINVPPDWNGGLVIFAHGYEGEGSGTGTVRSSSLDRHLAQRGYAWAASGYRAWGYRPDWFLLDLLTLRAHFINRFGQPRWTIIHGQSMGGHIGIASLELHPEIYQGALIECGVIDGVGLVDWRQAYTAAAEYFSGLPLLDKLGPIGEILGSNSGSLQRTELIIFIRPQIIRDGVDAHRIAEELRAKLGNRYGTYEPSLPRVLPRTPDSVR